MKNLTTILAALTLSLGSILQTYASTFYISINTGSDLNTGDAAHPIRSITEAAKRIDMHNDTSDELIILPGTYYIMETALFDKDHYSESQRLRIRASILPDDPAWSPQQMPIIVTAVPLTDDGFGGEQAIGIRVEVSHVTIEGLRFTGSADFIYKDARHTRRSYPVWRGGNDLTDLLVSQCLFTGNTQVMPLHVGIIANGNRLVIDHCVFFGCKIPVVFWRAKGGVSRGNAMRNSIVYGSTYAGVWTVETGPDFDFRQNILANCRTAWIREDKSSRNYTATDCIITNCTDQSGYGNPNATSVIRTPDDFLILKNVNKSSVIKLELDQSKRNYLQLATGSAGQELNAGLFRLQVN